MSFLRIKKQNGREYLYKVATRRVDGLVVQTQKYIRRATPEDRNLIRTSIKIQKLRSPYHQKRQQINQINELWNLLAKEKSIPPEKMIFQGFKNTRVYKALIIMAPWAQKAGAVIEKGRLTRKHMRGTLNVTMLYELSRLKNDSDRDKVFKYIKMRKIRTATRLRDIINQFNQN